MRIVGQAGSGEEGLRLVRELRPDVLLLDIQMPGTTGLDVAARLMHVSNPPAIIFVTAYDAYAIKAFEVEAVDYLLKPVDPIRLHKALQRIELSLTGDAMRRVLERLQPGAPERMALLEEASGVRHLTSLADIAWFTTQDERTYASVGGRLLRSMETLGALEEKLPADRFVRIHRAYIVNLAHVREVIPWANGSFNLRLHGCPQEIPLSRSYAPAFKTRTGWS